MKCSNSVFRVYLRNFVQNGGQSFSTAIVLDNLNVKYSENDHLFEIKNAQIFIVLCCLQKLYNFHNSR